MKIESYALSDIGLNRQNNEDAWGEIPPYFFALADGMGGHQAGEVASHETIESLLKRINNILTIPSLFSAEELSLELKEAILEANSWIYHLSQENEEMHGMGTTLCCLLIYEDFVFYAHVGDSRIYRFRNELKALTLDHSLRREMAERYHLDEKNGQGLPSKNVITRAIGTSYHVEPEIRYTPLVSGDIYLLCSDGLTDVVEESEIAAILKKNLSLKEASELLLQTALGQGGHDNITLILIKVVL